MFVLVDSIVLAVVLGLARSGWRRGFVSFGVDLVGFVAALVLAVRLHAPLSKLYAWAVSPGWAAFLGGVTAFVPFIVVVAVIGERLRRTFAKPGLRATDRVLGVGFGVALAACGLTFLLLIATVAPVPAGVTDAVRRSPTASRLLTAAEPVSDVLEDVAERDGRKWVLYVRQRLRNQQTAEKPTEQIDEPPAMHFPPVSPDALRDDERAERRLFRLVNDERARRGLRPLIWDDRLTAVGRAHSRDMYRGGYFAHRSREGTTPGQRLGFAGIAYQRSAENLALAPTVATAHDGLMRSAGHRRNILDPELTRLGIGIASGPHGLMASQEFCGGC